MLWTVAVALQRVEQGDRGGRGARPLCRNTHALFNGSWEDWPSCQGRRRSTGDDCVVSRNGSDPWTHSSLVIRGQPNPRFFADPPFAPRAWAPRDCSLQLFDAEEATKCLQKWPLHLVGDSTSNGVFDEMRWILGNHAFQVPPGRHPKLYFTRLEYVDVKGKDAQWVNEQVADQIIAQGYKNIVGGAKAIVLNTGPHSVKQGASQVVAQCAGAAERLNGGRWFHRVRHPNSWFVDHTAGGATRLDRYVTQLVHPDSWREALSALRTTFHGDACEAICLNVTKEAADQLFGFIVALRDKGFAGRIFWRSVPINFGYDHVENAENGRTFRSIMNHMSVLLNARVKSMVAQLRVLRVELMDTEEMTSARPETYFHENTFHFFCTCPDCEEESCPSNVTTGKDLRFVCKNTKCHERRGTYFDNGEPMRYLAQMHLHSLCATSPPTYREALEEISMVRR